MATASDRVLGDGDGDGDGAGGRAYGGVSRALAAISAR